MPKTVEIKSFTEFIEYVERNCIDDEILFRGQGGDWPLVPKIARIRPRGERLKTEGAMFSEFKRHATPHLVRQMENDFEWLALAQHHGMATRLLDWTMNPLAALWFAVRRPVTHQAQGVVWMFTPPSNDILSVEEVRRRNLSPFDQRRTVVFRPSMIASRIVSQAGWFTVHATSGGNFVALEENPLYKDTLVKFTIPASSFWKVRFQLDRCGVNQSTLFPDLDGVAANVEWRETLLPDEPSKIAPNPVRKSKSRGSKSKLRLIG